MKDVARYRGGCLGEAGFLAAFALMAVGALAAVAMVAGRLVWK